MAILPTVLKCCFGPSMLRLHCGITACCIKLLAMHCSHAPAPLNFVDVFEVTMFRCNPQPPAACHGRLLANACIQSMAALAAAEKTRTVIRGAEVGMGHSANRSPATAKQELNTLAHSHMPIPACRNMLMHAQTCIRTHAHRPLRAK